MATSKNDFLSSIGNLKDEFILTEVTNKMEAKGRELRLKCIELLNQRAVTSSGKLEDSISDPIITVKGSQITMQIKMADYYDYTNKGVKGWADSSKAPNSPYQFKTKGMNAKGVKSIEAYIKSGAKKVITFSNYGAYKELEKKFSRKGGKELIDFQVKNAVFGIKKKGIKAKRWFDDAVKDVFGDFQEVMAEAYGNDIVVSLNLKGK
jgi:hypothetical protein